MFKIIVISLFLTSVTFCQSDSLIGDVNDDGTIDVLDILLVVNIIIEEFEPTDDQFWAADMNMDGSIQVLDIIQLVNVIIIPLDCGDAFICPDNPYECCTDLHSESFLDCATCHTANFNQTENPVHSEQVFEPSYCNLCHNPVLGWISPNWSHIYVEYSCGNCHQPTIEHVQNMGHSVYECTHCHHDTEGLVVEPVCYDCHIDDYLAASDPDHSAMGLSSNCDICHGYDGWAGAEPHGVTDYPCSDCHNFLGNSDPTPEIDHLSAPKLGDDIYNCQLCHNSDENWSNVSFSSNRHDGSVYEIYFNLYSGPHNNHWGNTCAGNCHVFGAFDTFSCWDNCHAGVHNRNNILDEHCEDDRDCADCNGWNGYWNAGYIEFEDGSWYSPETFHQCYVCHPNGDKNGPCADD